MLKQKYYASGEFRVSPLAECQFADVSDNLDVNEQTVFLKLPSLIKGYLRLGAVVCGPPGLDRQFDTVDFLVLLDMHKLSSEYLNRFGLSVSEVSNAVG